MPVMIQSEENTQNRQTPRGFNYSHVGLKKLGASEYTLVTIAVDTSGSVSHKYGLIEKALGAIVKACEKAPRKDNLLIRLVGFSTSVYEIHGFRLRQDIGPDEYVNSLSQSGATALYEGCNNALDAIGDFSSELADQSYLANGLFVCITDGEDNRGQYTGHTTDKIKKAIADLRRSESLESINTILIGIDNGYGSAGDESSLSLYLENFKKEVGFDQYEWAGSLDDKTMARIANFISQSISSSSAALSTGGPSQPVTF